MIPAFFFKTKIYIMTYLAKVNPRRRNSFFPAHFDAFLNEVAKTNNFVKQKPLVNVSETDQAFSLEIAVPGLKKADIDLKIEDETLIISAKKEETKENYTRREFNFNNFERRFQLNETIDVENIKANFEDGILNIVLPKVIEEKKDTNRKIEIK